LSGRPDRVNPVAERRADRPMPMRLVKFGRRATDRRPPAGDLEATWMDQQRVVDVCRDVLRTDLSLDDDLPDLGLQSVLAVQLAVRLQEDFGVEVPL
jgi:hypothetical protein